MGQRSAARLGLACDRTDDPMKRDHLFKLFQEAHRIRGHKKYVVVGSLSILGSQDEDGLPAEMSMSNDIDSYTKADPGRINDLNAARGEGSKFHNETNSGTLVASLNYGRTKSQLVGLVAFRPSPNLPVAADHSWS